MKIILCAFAVLPNSGSESGVGWNWLKTLIADGHDVSVVTRIEHAQALETLKAGAQERVLSGVRIFGIGWAGREKVILRKNALLYFYTLLWNILVTFWLRRALRTEHFDVVHHVTYAGVRIPIFTPLIFDNVVWGPVGGGEAAPMRIVRRLGWTSLAKEGIRALSNVTLRFNPIMFPAFYRSRRIFVLTGETLRLLPPSVRHKATIHPNIGTEDGEVIAPQLDAVAPRGLSDGAYFVFVARFIYWKGGELVLRAFKLYLDRGGTASLAMVGDGPLWKHWTTLAAKLDIADRVTWFGRVPRQEALDIIRHSQAMIFPSLHDSGGTVVYEAVSLGVPLVCLDLGGPGEIARRLDLSPVPVTPGVGFDALVYALSERLDDLPGQAAVERAQAILAEQFSWEAIVRGVYGAAPLE